MRGFHVFLATIAILSVITLCIPLFDPPVPSGIPEPKASPSKLTNIPFTSTAPQRELFALLNGRELKPGNYSFVSPASSEETAKVCAEMQFSLPVTVECEGRVIRLSVSEFVRGMLVMHSWFRVTKAELAKQEFLELGLLLTECGQDLCVPLDRDVKLAPPVEGEDHRPGVAQ